MLLKTLYVRFYKSFNYDYLRKSAPNAVPDPWDILEGDLFYPFVRIPMEKQITTVVGANESGKSQLLSAIKCLLTGKAIERRDFDHLPGELGDLLFQVVYYSQLAREEGRFEFASVVDGITRKLIRRHPHVFPTGDLYAPLDLPRLDEEQVKERWEQIKAEERVGKADSSSLAGVALALPALERAEKLQKRAARTGFDWPDATGARAKVVEELAELDAETEHDRRSEELGDLLFAVVNLARKLGIAPEAALRKANSKFERRFRAIEVAPSFDRLSLDEKEALWVAAKADQSA